jgi:hypothetical protein
VLHPTEKYVSVLLIIPHGLIVENSDGNYAIPSDKLKPIPLTEEWLLKFGFDKIDFQFIKNGIKLFPIRDLYYRGNFPIKSDIKYVHQLQNLFFALTGEELTIKN